MADILSRFSVAGHIVFPSGAGKQAIINDINAKLTAFYKGVQNNYPMLRTELDEIEKHSTLLANAEIYNVDYRGIFSMAKSDDFIFSDTSYDCIFSDYGNGEYKDGFNDDCHITLSEDFKRLKCNALFVIGRTPLTEKLFRQYS